MAADGIDERSPLISPHSGNVTPTAPPYSQESNLRGKPRRHPCNANPVSSLYVSMCPPILTGRREVVLYCLAEWLNTQLWLNTAEVWAIAALVLCLPGI